MAIVCLMMTWTRRVRTWWVVACDFFRNLWAGMSLILGDSSFQTVKVDDRRFLWRVERGVWRCSRAFRWCAVWTSSVEHFAA